DGGVGVQQQVHAPRRAAVRGADVLLRAGAGPVVGGRDHARGIVPHPRHRGRAGRLVLALEFHPADPRLPRLRGGGHRRGEPHALRPARGGDGAGGRLPHRVLVDALRAAADGRVREHDHGGRGRDEPLLRRVALARALPARLAPVVLRQDVRGPLLLHLAARHAAPPALRPAHGLRLEGPGAAGHAEHPGHRGRGGLPPLRAMITVILFYVFAALAVAAALVVVAQRNPIYSAFGLIVTLCSLSAIFGLLGS